LQSYSHKQLNTHLLEYIEVPGETIWSHRMQEKLSAAGAPPRTPLGSLQRSPDPLAGGEGHWLQLHIHITWTSLLLFPHSKIVPPLDSGWRRPWILYRLRLNWNLCWRLLFLHSSAGSGFSY